ncbi:MAG: AarF/ABC1/UbiB kinase family protein [Pseudomonadota bacterium]
MHDFDRRCVADSRGRAFMTPDNLAPSSRTSALSGRVKRYAKVGSSVGSLATKLAGMRYFGIDIDRTAHADEIKTILGELKGPIMKVAQILAMIPHAVPTEYAQAFGDLQSNAPPMGWPFVKRRMAFELGQDWQSLFAEFPRQATAAASLGQVHKARTQEGHLVACKLQYPDMATAVDADLRNLKLLLNIFERYDKAIATDEIFDEIAGRLWEELDYQRERQHMALYRHMFADLEGVRIPQPLEALSTDRLMTATWLEGQHVMTLKDMPQKLRDQVAYNIFQAWYVPLYRYGVLHGDPHAGNYSVISKQTNPDTHAPEGTLNLLDFGCVRIFPPKLVSGVITLYRALQTDDAKMTAEAYEMWGFRDLNKELIGTLDIWARFIFGPVLDNRRRLIDPRGGEVYGRAEAQKVHIELRKHGGVKPPGEFVFMDRAALGLGSVFIHLAAKINWYKLFNEMIEDHDEDALQARQTKTLTRFDLC